MSAPDVTPEPIGNRQALGDIVRALRYIRPLRAQYTRKLGYTILAMFPGVLLPWPGKVLIDNVIQGIPIEDSKYPFFFQPVVDQLRGATPWEMALGMLVFTSILLVLVGGYGSDTARDTTNASLAQGSDLATQSENTANEGWSFVGGILGFLEYRLTLRLNQALNHHYRSHLFEHIQRLPMTHLDDQRIGDAIYRLMYDTPQITEVCTRIVLTPITSPIRVAMIVWVMSLTFGDVPAVLAAATLLVPVGFFASLPFTRSIRRRGQLARSSGAATTTTVEEGVSNVLVVQGLGGQARESERFERDSWRSYTESRYFMLVWMVFGVVVGLAGAIVGIYVFYQLTDLVFAGEMTVGDLAVIMSFFGQLGGVASNVGRMWIYLQDNVVGLRRVFELMDSASDPQPQDARRLETIREGFRFEHVGYAYPDGTVALDDVDFEARRGTMVAVVGPAGAGKTTLAYLIPRFLSPTQGRVWVDGVDLAAVDREDLRAQVAFVFQEPALFDATIAENIRVGRPDATDEQVRRAAETAGASEFIDRLPQGYDTPLGRSGGRLSVGQKQRLSIARALVREAPVLVLDEPTAALDPETEWKLVETLKRVSRDCLVLVIAHRLSTIRSADQILFLGDGRITERGSHAELMAIEGGAYRHFVELQSGEAAA